MIEQARKVHKRSSLRMVNNWRAMNLGHREKVSILQQMRMKIMVALTSNLLRFSKASTLFPMDKTKIGWVFVKIILKSSCLNLRNLNRIRHCLHLVAKTQRSQWKNGSLWSANRTDWLVISIKLVISAIRGCKYIARETLLLRNLKIHHIDPLKQTKALTGKRRMKGQQNKRSAVVPLVPRWMDKIKYLHTRSQLKM